MTRIKVFVAEDHATVRDGLKMLIAAQDDMEVVGEASNGDEVMSRVAGVAPDVVLLDVSMPGTGGARTAELLNEQHPGIRVLVLTRHAETAYVRRLIGAGASGYALKQSPSADLLAAVRTVASGAPYIDAAVAGDVIALAGTHAGERRRTRELSTREAEVLRAVAEGHTNRAIAERLGLSVKTVEAHRANAMEKLELSARADIVRIARLRGWLDEL
jgi:DNA-binding NarL/FixJ family response regulator